MLHLYRIALGITSTLSVVTGAKTWSLSKKVDELESKIQDIDDKAYHRALEDMNNAIKLDTEELRNKLHNSSKPKSII